MTGRRRVPGRPRRPKRVHELTGHDPYEPGTALGFQVALLIRRLDNQVGR